MAQSRMEQIMAIYKSNGKNKQKRKDKARSKSPQQIRNQQGKTPLRQNIKIKKPEFQNKNFVLNKNKRQKNVLEQDQKLTEEMSLISNNLYIEERKNYHKQLKQESEKQRFFSQDPQ